MTGPMANLAPGHRRSTAWASTWAVEWRRTSRPASESAVTMATSAPSVRVELRSTSRPSTVATTAALARRGPIDGANSAAVVPSESSRIEPSGSRTEMTPAIVLPFLWWGDPNPRNVDAPGYWTLSGRPDLPDCELEDDAQQSGTVGHRPPGQCLGVAQFECARRVQIVIERGPHGRQAASPVALGGGAPQRQARR